MVVLEQGLRGLDQHLLLVLNVEREEGQQLVVYFLVLELADDLVERDLKNDLDRGAELVQTGARAPQLPRDEPGYLLEDAVARPLGLRLYFTGYGNKHLQNQPEAEQAGLLLRQLGGVGQEVLIYRVGLRSVL